MSSIAPIEVRSAIARRVRTLEISAKVAADAKVFLTSVSERFTPWRVETVFEEAVRLVEQRSLRTLDALQLACALDVRRYIRSTDSLLFIASDVRLSEAARAEGLACWNPEIDPTP